MRTLSIIEFVTLDGVMQGFHAPDPADPSFVHGGWGIPYQDPAMQQQGSQGQVNTTAYLFGRRTYEALAAFWPHQPDENPMAYHLNHMPKYVATRTLSTLDWSGARILKGELVPAVRALKRDGDGTIVVLGSGDVAQQLFADGVVDAYTIFIHPLVLGSGKRLFRDVRKPLPLRLQNVSHTDSGVLVVNYHTA